MKEPLNPEVAHLYEVITLPEKPEAWCVRFVDGKWCGITYTYGKIEMIKEGEHLRCRIEHDILFVPKEFEGKKYSLEDKANFEQLIGKIAMNILYEENERLSPSKEDPNKLVLSK